MGHLYGASSLTHF